MTDELSRCVNVKEKSITKALDSAGIARPHIEEVFVNVYFFIVVKVTRKTTDLFVLLLTQDILDKFRHEIQDVFKMGLLTKLIGLLRN